MTSATSEGMHVHPIQSLAPLSWDTSLHALLPLRQHALEHISSPPRCSPVWPCIANLDPWAAQAIIPSSAVLHQPLTPQHRIEVDQHMNQRGSDPPHTHKFHEATESTPLEKLPASSSQTFELGGFFPGFDDGLLLCQCSCIRLQDVCSLLWP